MKFISRFNNSQVKAASGKMNNLHKLHDAGLPEALGPMQLHRLQRPGLHTDYKKSACCMQTFIMIGTFG